MLSDRKDNAKPNLSVRTMRFALRNRIVLIGVAIFIFAGAITPTFTSIYYTKSIFDTFFLYVILAESYDVMGGLMGYVNLGITLLYGAGAYAFGIEYYVFHVPAGEAFLIGAAVSAVIGLLESFPVFRLRGFYFAVATLALVPLGQYIVQAPNFESYTGGIGGINGLPVDYLSGYYVIFLFAVFTIFLVYFIARSSLGLALTSIREDEQIAESSGINTSFMKRVAMVISATLAGAAGCLFAWTQGTLLPQNVFSLSFAFIPVTFALFGGTGTVLGPIIGTAVYSTLDAYVHSPQVALNASTSWLQNYEFAIVGIFLVVVGLFAPDGILGLARRGYAKFRASRGDSCTGRD